MPQDNPHCLRYLQIEDMAKALGWNKAKSYFANMVDKDNDKMMQQLDSENTVSVLWNCLEEMRLALAQLRLANSNSRSDLGPNSLSTGAGPSYSGKNY